jgi:hypothetical protein
MDSLRGEFESLAVASHPLQPDWFTAGPTRISLNGFSHLPALTGEKLKPFNFKHLSDERGLII